MEKVMLRKQQAADAMQVSVRTLEKLIAERAIKIVRVGSKCVRVPADEILRFVKRNAR